MMTKAEIWGRLCVASRVSVLLVTSLFWTSVQGAERDEVVFFHTDRLGSAIAAVNEQGELCWNEAYSPYGGKQFHGDALPTEGCGLLGE